VEFLVLSLVLGGALVGGCDSRDDKSVNYI